MNQIKSLKDLRARSGKTEVFLSPSAKKLSERKDKDRKLAAQFVSVKVEAICQNRHCGAVYLVSRKVKDGRSYCNDCMRRRINYTVARPKKYR